MKTLSFTEFIKRASEILSLVEKGETVRVIRHGKTVAKIVPAETEEKSPSWKGRFRGWYAPVLRSVRRFWTKGGSHVECVLRFFSPGETIH